MRILETECSLHTFPLRQGLERPLELSAVPVRVNPRLVNLIPRFYDATAGAVRINGEDVKNYDKESLRHMVGVVPQKAVLFNGTIADNLQLG